jgi:TIR domain
VYAATSLAVLTGFAIIVVAVFNLLLPLSVGIGFLVGISATVLVLKAMGYSRHPVRRIATVKSPEIPDTLGPETIFVSYGRKDWDRYAKQIVERLRSANLTVWLDQSYIQGGDDWMDSIDVALKTCQRMLLCVTATALESKYVKKEYRYFIQNDKPIYPIICERSELPFELEGIQQLDFNDIESIIAAIRRGRPVKSRKHASHE